MSSEILVLMQSLKVTRTLEQPLGTACVSDRKIRA